MASDFRIVNGTVPILDIMVRHLEEFPEHVEYPFECRTCQFAADYIAKWGF